MKSLRLLLVGALAASACQSSPEDDAASAEQGLDKGLGGGLGGGLGEGLGPRLAIDYFVPKRTYRDGDASCAPDLTPTAKFVSPDSWPVTLDACKTRVDAVIGYSWRVNGTPINGNGCRVETQVPSLGTHRVSVAALTLGGSVSGERDVLIRDYLVVSIGDSIASGEGNPDRPAPWRYDVGWNDTACHRSWNSGPALAAIRLEDADPHSSVTFISTACSGDAIRNGILTSRESRPPQVEKVKSLIGNRTIDTLVLQAGANDVGFGDVVRMCGHPFDECWEDEYENEGRSLHYAVSERLLFLPEHYDRLAKVVKAELPSNKVVLGQYPDPTQDGRGGYCEMEFVDAAGPINGNISSREAKWAWGQVVLPLNNRVLQAVGRHQWETINMDASTYHGYCAADRWTTRYEESHATQGDELGTLHPNRAGHEQYAAAIYNIVLPQMAATNDLPRLVTAEESKDRGRCRVAPPRAPLPEFCQDGSQAERCEEQRNQCASTCDPGGGGGCECQCDNSFDSCMSVCGGNRRPRSCPVR